MIDPSSQPEGTEKILLMVDEQMNSSYGKRTLPTWHLSKPALEKQRAQRYEIGTQSEEALVAV